MIMSTMIIRLFLVASLAMTIVKSSTSINSLPSTATTTTTTSTRNSNPESNDLLAEYLLNNLLRQNTPPPSSSLSSPLLTLSNKNRNQYQKLSTGLSRLPLSGLLLSQQQQQQQQQNFIDKQQDLDQEEDTNRLLSDFYTSLLDGNINDNNNGHQDISWFDGPVLPKVTALANDYGDDTYLGDVDNDQAIGYDPENLIQPSLIPYPYMNYRQQQQQQQPIDNFDDTTTTTTIFDNPTLMNILLANYLTTHQQQNDFENQDSNRIPILRQTNDDDDNVDEYDEKPIENLYNYDNDKLTMKNLELYKRRQKVIKHENDNNNKIETTTTKPLSSSSLSTTMKTTTGTGGMMMKEEREGKKFSQHTIPKSNLKHSKMMMIMNGQKEYPMLRPSSENNKNNNENNNDQPTESTGNNNNEWPSELEENTLAEEDSLKQLPKQQQQQRMVRDTLTSQLDSLKMETKRNIQSNNDIMMSANINKRTNHE
ncbi:uncharacterized protein LOC113791571 [Dermatophagoides pteronyssinus]|uniref:uncharacterized protein LOC113791571 n=1 Tax=Dermatophagoides pteronyssinus TaxID=6956 RepID=UPI003F66669D